jgi:hypothetical protein
MIFFEVATRHRLIGTIKEDERDFNGWFLRQILMGVWFTLGPTMSVKCHEQQ